MSVVLFDHDVLLAAMVSQHPDHERCHRWLAGSKSGSVQALVAQHALAELQIELVRLPARPRLSAGSAERLIRSNIELNQIVSLTPSAYWIALERAARAGSTGDSILQHLTLQAALGAGAQNLLTLDPAAYRRLGLPDGFVITP